jgi:tetratricopeptide (TPR) repeat protein
MTLISAGPVCGEQVRRAAAVKLLHPTRRDDPDAVARFFHEARICARLQHPGIVPIHDVGWFDDGRPFIAMKLVHGWTLAGLLAERTGPAQDRTWLLGVFEHLCQAMAYAHRQGVIHRDLKPSNIMVGAFGEVQVMDWGLAKVRTKDEGRRQEEPGSATSRPHPSASDDHAPPLIPHPSTVNGLVIGTPAYMSPEQARGELDRLDERGDVFALGAILCEILTGAPPYRAVNGVRVGVLAREADLEDAFARLEGCGVDAEVIGLARRFLAADPAGRPADAAEAGALFAGYQETVQERLRQAQIDRARAETRAAEERKRRRVWVALSVAVVALVLIVGGVWLSIAGERAAVARRRAETNDALRRLQPRLADVRGLTARTRDPVAWSQVRKLAEQARALIASGLADAALAEQVTPRLRDLDLEEKDRRLLDEVDRLYLARSEVDLRANKFVSWTKMIPAYRAAFARYGLSPGTSGAGAAVAQLRGRPEETRAAICAVLDFWLHEESPREDPATTRWLLDVLQVVDPDPWRRQVRRAGLARDETTLKKLAAEVDVATQPPQALSLLARKFWHKSSIVETLDLLQRARRRYPDDFWLNQDLALAYHFSPSPRFDEAVRYYTVALALRRSAGVELNLGMALISLHRYAEAAAELKTAIELAPDYAMAHDALGCARFRQGRFAEAAASFERALGLVPDFAGFYLDLGQARRNLGDFAGATAALQGALKLNDRYSEAYAELGEVSYAQQSHAEALVNYRGAFKLAPDAVTDMHTDDDPRCHAHAAECDARIGAGSDASSPAPWRQQAIQWLRAELTICERQAKDGTPEAIREVRSLLVRWQHDPAFATIRDPRVPDPSARTGAGGLPTVLGRSGRDVGGPPHGALSPAPSAPRRQRTRRGDSSQ